jgi:hypothetical protein
MIGKGVLCNSTQEYQRLSLKVIKLSLKRQKQSCESLPTKSVEVFVGYMELCKLGFVMDQYG